MGGVHCVCMARKKSVKKKTQKKNKGGVAAAGVSVDGGGGEVVLPEQEKFFSTSGLKGKARAGTNLPDPRRTPEGFDKDQKFRHLFPEVHLPPMFPDDDRVSFQSPDLPENELYFGDNLYILRDMDSECIDLIYIDPPFFSNKNYTVAWGDDNEVRSFNDIFQDGMYSYLSWLNARLWEMRRVLKDTGSIYVHCDWHASHYIKTEMDKVFGYDNFVNEIAWSYYSGGGSETKGFTTKHDVILFYAKDNKKGNKTFNVMYEKKYVEGKKEGVEKLKNGEREWKKDDDPTCRYTKHKTRKSEVEYRPICYTEILQRDTWYIPFLNPMAGERIGYPTQKPEALLERIIKASSNEGDIVADFFMGGGTTGAVALKLGRRFIGSDSSRVAVSVAASRLISVGEEVSGVMVKEKEEGMGLQMKHQDVADIRIGYVGNYPAEKFTHISDEEFRKFVRDIYGASAYSGDSKHIHGLANGKIVLHIGEADPEKSTSAKGAKDFVADALKYSEKHLGAGEQRVFQIISWGFDPAAVKWKEQAVKMLNKKEMKVRLDFVSLGDKAFRERIFRNIGDKNIDLKFNSLDNLLIFSRNPYIREIKVQKQKGLTLTFDLPNAKAIGSAKLINCQWDFSFKDGRFADKAHALNRNQKTFEAVLTAEHTFSREGDYIIAARIQDSLGGEAVASGVLKVGKSKSTIKMYDD